MMNIKSIKNLTAGALLALANCLQAFAGDTGSCGTNCQYTYENETLTFSPIDSSQEAIISEPVLYYGLSGQVKNAIINEGITDVLYNNNGYTSTLSSIGKADGKFVIPSTMRSFSSAAAGDLRFGTVEINSNNMSFGIEGFWFNSNTPVNIIMSADSNFTFDEKTMYRTYTGTYQYPASLTISCKGNPDTCLAKFGNALDNMTRTITPGYYEEYDASGNPVEIWNENGGFKYDLNGNLVEKYNINGKIAEQYDANGNVIAKYNTDGNLLAQYRYATDGSVAIYDANGKLIGLQGKRIYTIDEATQLLGSNNKNTFSIRYR